MDVLKDPAKIYNFPPHKRGDTVNSRTFNITINGQEPISSIVNVKIDLRKNNKVIYRYDVPSGKITLISPGTFVINSHILEIPEGNYVYDIQLNFENGVIKTYIKGIWKIYEDYTK